MYARIIIYIHPDRWNVSVKWIYTHIFGGGHGETEWVSAADEVYNVYRKNTSRRYLFFVWENDLYI